MKNLRKVKIKGKNGVFSIRDLKKGDLFKIIKERDPNWYTCLSNPHPYSDNKKIYCVTVD